MRSVTLPINSWLQTLHRLNICGLKRTHIKEQASGKYHPTKLRPYKEAAIREAFSIFRLIGWRFIPWKCLNGVKDVQGINISNGSIKVSLILPWRYKKPPPAGGTVYVVCYIQYGVTECSKMSRHFAVEGYNFSWKEMLHLWELRSIAEERIRGARHFQHTQTLRSFPQQLRL